MTAQTSRNLPEQSTALIGRATELAEICARVADPYCRLLTLVGPGGIGKTRLAVEVAARMHGFTDGNHYVALQPVASADLLVPAIATAIGLPLAGKEPLLTQLLHTLRGKHMLLLLDDFEHLLPAADLLAEMLRDAPGVKLLVTSREVVGIREEWLYPIQGLAVPPMAAAIEPADYGAVHLFCTRARQVRRDFRWDRERDAVISICRHVEGNPLAVELAVSWLSTLDSAAISNQLRQGMDILTSSLRNVPERHRSMRVVFEHSWQLLDEAERAVFARLTVFRGGFTLAAAQAVAAATLADVSVLVAKSLIRRDADGRYHIHELLRQYAAEKLAASPASEMEALRAYADYFLTYLNERREVFEAAEQLDAVREVAAEHENIYAAWRWSVDHIWTTAQAESLRLAVGALTRYLQLSSRYLEGAVLLGETIRKLEGDSRGNGTAAAARDAILGECLIYASYLAIRLGRPTQAEQLLARVRQLYDRMPALSRYGFMNVRKASMILALVQGDYSRAVTLAQEARLLAQEQGETPSLSLAHYALANAALAQGETEPARREAEQALALAESAGHRFLSLTVYDILGQIASAQGELPTAKRHFETAYAISEEFGAPGIMALHLKNLGDVALLQRQWIEARAFFRQSLERYHLIGDRGGAVTAERGLGVAAHHLGDRNGACRHFRHALEMAVASETTRLILSVLAAAGEFLAEQLGVGRRHTLGLRILRFTAQHASADQATRNAAADYLQRKGASLHEPVDTSLEMLSAALQAELATAPEPVLPTVQAQRSTPVEQLTAREVEVLKLLGAGRTNAEIARELVLAVGTVKFFTSSIYRKLDVMNRAQAVVRAHALGMLD